MSRPLSAFGEIVELFLPVGSGVIRHEKGHRVYFSVSDTELETLFANLNIGDVVGYEANYKTNLPHNCQTIATHAAKECDMVKEEGKIIKIEETKGWISRNNGPVFFPGSAFASGTEESKDLTRHLSVGDTVYYWALQRNKSENDQLTALKVEIKTPIPETKNDTILAIVVDTNYALLWSKTFYKIYCNPKKFKDCPSLKIGSWVNVKVEAQEEKNGIHLQASALSPASKLPQHVNVTEESECVKVSGTGLLCSKNNNTYIWNEAIGRVACKQNASISRLSLVRFCAKFQNRKEKKNMFDDCWITDWVKKIDDYPLLIPGDMKFCKEGKITKAGDSYGFICGDNPGIFYRGVDYDGKGLNNLNGKTVTLVYVAGSHEGVENYRTLYFCEV